MSALLEIVLGGVLLVLGRKLFWLFVAGVGFAVGMFITPLLLPDASQGVTLAAAVALAVLGAVLAITMQKIAIGLVGFIAGGLIALWLLRALAFDPGRCSGWSLSAAAFWARCSLRSCSIGG